MYATLVVYHSGRDLVERLRAAFPAHDPTALSRSLVFADPRWQALVPYATETRDLRLICYPTAIDQLQIVVEPVETDVRHACQHAWRTIRRAARWRNRISLAELVVVDELSGERVARATTGWGSAIARRDLWPGLAVAVFTIVWLGISSSTFARDHVAQAILGAVPSIVAGATALMALYVLRHRLIWHVEESRLD